MKAVVDQALRHVVDRDLARLLNGPQVENAFMRDQATISRVEHRVVRRKPPGEVISREDRRLGRRFQTVGAHHCDIHPRNRQDPGTAVRRCRYRSDPPYIRRARWQVAVSREELCEMRADCDRSDAGAAAAVRNAECLVQIQVRDVGAERARRGQAH